MLPLVIYNGETRWHAARDISELIEEVPGGLKKYRPQLKYFLLDEGAFGEATLAPLHNLAAALFRMENSRGKKTCEEVTRAIRLVLRQLTEWLKEPEQTSLRRDFVTWLLRVLLPKNLPDVKLPEVIELQEMHDMLYETAQGWYKEAEAKGRSEGKSEMLIPLLETKFGTLDASVYTRIHGLDSAELQACSKRLFSAQTVEEVLGKTH